MYTGLSSNKEIIDSIINTLNKLEVDGETMEYIINGTNYNDYLHHCLIMKNSLKDTYTSINEKLEQS